MNQFFFWMYGPQKKNAKRRISSLFQSQFFRRLVPGQTSTLLAVSFLRDHLCKMSPSLCVEPCSPSSQKDTRQGSVMPVCSSEMHLPCKKGQPPRGFGVCVSRIQCTFYLQAVASTPLLPTLHSPFIACAQSPMASISTVVWTFFFSV